MSKSKDIDLEKLKDEIDKQLEIFDVDIIDKYNVNELYDKKVNGDKNAR